MDPERLSVRYSHEFILMCPKSPSSSQQTQSLQLGQCQKEKLIFSVLHIFCTRIQEISSQMQKIFLCWSILPGAPTKVKTIKLWVNIGKHACSDIPRSFLKTFVSSAYLILLKHKKYPRIGLKFWLPYILAVTIIKRRKIKTSKYHDAST